MVRAESFNFLRDDHFSVGIKFRDNPRILDPALYSLCILLLNPVLLHPLLNHVWRYEKSLRHMLNGRVEGEGYLVSSVLSRGKAQPLSPQAPCLLILPDTGNQQQTH